MIQVSINELIALVGTIATMAFTAGAWVTVFRRQQARQRKLERFVYENIHPRLAAIDGGKKPATMELPAVYEDSGG